MYELTMSKIHLMIYSAIYSMIYSTIHRFQPFKAEQDRECIYTKSRVYTGKKRSVAFSPLALFAFPLNSGLRPETRTYSNEFHKNAYFGEDDQLNRVEVNRNCARPELFFARLVRVVHRVPLQKTPQPRKPFKKDGVCRLAKKPFRPLRPPRCKISRRP